MHIDEALLDRVIKIYGYASKTEAVEMALRELDRKARYRDRVSKGLGMNAAALAAGVAKGYDPNELRVAAPPRGHGH